MNKIKNKKIFQSINQSKDKMYTKLKSGEKVAASSEKTREKNNKKLFFNFEL
jgi:hypothetical protein